MSKYLRKSVTKQQRILISRFCRDLLEQLKKPEKNRRKYFRRYFGLCYHYKGWAKKRRISDATMLYRSFVGTWPFYMERDLYDVPFWQNPKRMRFVRAMAGINK